jgi:hypothetical protein
LALADEEHVAARIARKPGADLEVTENSRFRRWLAKSGK